MNALLDFIEFSLSGLSVGAIYALTGIGFVLVYKATRVINFAIGEFMMIGGVPFAHGEAEALRDVLCAILMPGIGGGIHSGSASPDGSATAAIYI